MALREKLLRCCYNKHLVELTFRRKANEFKTKTKTGVRLSTVYVASLWQGIYNPYKDRMNKQTMVSTTQDAADATASQASASSTTTTGDLNVSKNKVIKKYLAAFDFDYTVVAQNTDTVIRDLLPPHKLTKDMQDIIELQGWTEYMAEVFRRLHESNVKPEKILQTIQGIPEVPGFVRMLKRLNAKYGCDLIVISDSNSIFIEEWLRSHGLTDSFVKVFTNPAHFEEDTCLLRIQPFHHQTDCRLSSVNLCKGKVLEHFLIEQDLRFNLTYEHVIYVGDGNNDICPVTKLRQRDIACAREGFSMEKTLAKNPMKLKVRSEFITWKTGFDLLDKLERHMEKVERLKQEQQKQESAENPQPTQANMETTKVH